MSLNLFLTTRPRLRADKDAYTWYQSARRRLQIRMPQKLYLQGILFSADLCCWDVIFWNFKQTRRYPDTSQQMNIILTSFTTKPIKVLHCKWRASKPRISICLNLTIGITLFWPNRLSSWITNTSGRHCHFVQTAFVPVLLRMIYVLRKSSTAIVMFWIQVLCFPQVNIGYLSFKLE